MQALLPGRVEGLCLDPSVLRLNVDVLAREIELAVNAALAELQRRAVTRAGAVDLGGLTDQLKEIQSSAERRFSAFTASLAAAQEELARRAEGR